MNLQEKITSAILSKFKKKDGTINYSAAAKELDVSRQAVMGWAKGSVNANEIKIENLIKIADVTEKPVEWFLSNEKHASQEPKAPYENIDLSALMSAATPRSHAILENLAQAFRDEKLTESDLELLDTLSKRFMKN